MTNLGGLPMIRAIAAIVLLTLLGACADNTASPPEEIARAAYQSGEPPYIEVLSMVSEKTGQSDHTGVVVNAPSQRVLYDPAGNFKHPSMPHKGDVFYGASDRMVDYYKRFHARFGFYVQSQKVYVSASEAEQFLREIESRPPTRNVFCGASTASVLRTAPSFSDYMSAWFLPETVRINVSRMPNVVTTDFYENDRGKNLVISSADTAAE
ncbi:hypothetical protein [Oceanomicrobium pacificus]|uniref:Lipoprotein n=1 Tax=Oceanomicrobium pacificus TaxID=2692916 RepID=A0A6B0U7G8_9RHOB|nr:hypothetical protein [Oceanomicrobium pacificus]MXU66811.1 hypothetical protein [Oceanomicrobium pacificus]